MLGERKQRVVVVTTDTIDYTKVALPLTVQDFADDIAEFQCGRMGMPDAIVVWEHQWDWIKKVHRNNSDGYRYGTLWATDAEAKMKDTVFGIPVELAA